jgi:hypothetical protein
MDAQTITMPTVDTDRTWKRGFWSVRATQFQVSLSDNAYRFLVFSFVADIARPESMRGYFTMIAGVLYALPFVLFSQAGV